MDKAFSRLKILAVVSALLLIATTLTAMALQNGPIVTACIVLQCISALAFVISLVMIFVIIIKRSAANDG